MFSEAYFAVLNAQDASRRCAPYAQQRTAAWAENFEVGFDDGDRCANAVADLASARLIAAENEVARRQLKPRLLVKRPKAWPVCAKGAGRSAPAGRHAPVV